MVNLSERQIDEAMAALADGTRRAIVRELAADVRAGGNAGVPVGALAAPFADRMSLPAVSKHLRVLERAGLIEQRKDGRMRRCFLRAEPLSVIDRWLDDYREFWTDRLNALADLLESPPEDPSPENTDAPPQSGNQLAASTDESWD